MTANLRRLGAQVCFILSHWLDPGVASQWALNQFVVAFATRAVTDSNEQARTDVN